MHLVLFIVQQVVVVFPYKESLTKKTCTFESESKENL